MNNADLVKAALKDVHATLDELARRIRALPMPVEKEPWRTKLFRALMTLRLMLQTAKDYTTAVIDLLDMAQFAISTGIPTRLARYVGMTGELGKLSKERTKKR